MAQEYIIQGDFVRRSLGPLALMATGLLWKVMAGMGASRSRQAKRQSAVVSGFGSLA